MEIIKKTLHKTGSLPKEEKIFSENLNDGSNEEAERIRQLVGQGLPPTEAVKQEIYWLEAFLSRYFPDREPLRYYKNCFPLYGGNERLTKKKLFDFAEKKTDVLICCRTIEPVLDSSPLLLKLIKNDIQVIQFFNEERSLTAIRLFNSFGKIFDSVGAKELKNVKMASESRKKKADRTALALKETIEEIEQSGIKTLRGIAEELTKKEIATPYKKSEWNQVTVKRIKDRLKKIASSSKP